MKTLFFYIISLFMCTIAFTNNSSGYSDKELIQSVKKLAQDHRMMKDMISCVNKYYKKKQSLNSGTNLINSLRNETNRIFDSEYSFIVHKDSNYVDLSFIDSIRVFRAFYNKTTFKDTFSIDISSDPYIYVINKYGTYYLFSDPDDEFKKLIKHEFKKVDRIEKAEFLAMLYFRCVKPTISNYPILNKEAFQFKSYEKNGKFYIEYKDWIINLRKLVDEHCTLRFEINRKGEYKFEKEVIETREIKPYK